MGPQRLIEVLLSSYALGESHPDSCWMAFEVRAFVEITFSIHPHPYPPPRGGGSFGVLDGFLSLGDQESFLRFVGRIVPALAGLIRHEKGSAQRRVNSAEA